MQFSDRFAHFSIQLLYSSLRYPNPWTLATFCIGTYTLNYLFTYWYSARFCQGNARRRTFFQVKKEAREMARPSLPLRDHSQFLPAYRSIAPSSAAASRKSGAHSSRKRSTCCSQRPM